MANGSTSIYTLSAGQTEQWDGPVYGFSVLAYQAGAAFSINAGGSVAIPSLLTLTSAKGWDRLQLTGPCTVMLALSPDAPLASAMSAQPQQFGDVVQTYNFTAGQTVTTCVFAKPVAGAFPFRTFTALLRTNGFLLASTWWYVLREDFGDGAGYPGILDGFGNFSTRHAAAHPTGTTGTANLDHIETIAYIGGTYSGGDTEGTLVVTGGAPIKLPAPLASTIKLDLTSASNGPSAVVPASSTIRITGVWSV
jgi:hypothetical protein